MKLYLEVTQAFYIILFFLVNEYGYQSEIFCKLAPWKANLSVIHSKIISYIKHAQKCAIPLLE